MNLVLRITYVLLCSLFIWYTFNIYARAGEKRADDFDTNKAASGRLVWQNYNCQACHQLYGLGGYLGPDLTNVYSAGGKGEDYIKALIKSGTKQMPGFHLTELEMEQLMEFLKSTDASGSADPRSFITTRSGMIQQHAKQ
ncbi:MAG: cytochrome c [Bacteroidia bacterium]|jgi:nitric oxide reductase subunit C|nr:cytochrome c [Bacteroidia bacterium]